MSGRAGELTQWCYRGVWGVMARWFRVPEHPPELPVLEGESSEAFKPALGFLRYRKFKFWIGLGALNLTILVLWIVGVVIDPFAGVLLLPVAILAAVVPDVIAYLAIHLQYDTTWYVMSDRSLRIRRGIWIIHETTITFENVQNVSVNQGPVQRFFGIADVLVETAGGAGAAHQQPGQAGAAAIGPHTGMIQGVADAPRIRDLIMHRLAQSRTAGLGDDTRDESPGTRVWTPARLEVLREIRDVAAELAART